MNTGVILALIFRVRVVVDYMDTRFSNFEIEYHCKNEKFLIEYLCKNEKFLKTVLAC